MSRLSHISALRDSNKRTGRLTHVSLYLFSLVYPTQFDASIWLVPRNPGLEQGRSYYRLPSHADMFPYLLGPVGFWTLDTLHERSWHAVWLPWWESLMPDRSPVTSPPVTSTLYIFMIDGNFMASAFPAISWLTFSPVPFPSMFFPLCYWRLFASPLPVLCSAKAHSLCCELEHLHDSLVPRWSSHCAAWVCVLLVVYRISHCLDFLSPFPHDTVCPELQEGLARFFFWRCEFLCIFLGEY